MGRRRLLQCVGGDSEIVVGSWRLVLAVISNNTPMVWWMGKLGRFLWIRKPWRAFLRADAIVMAKSGAARVRGQRILRPPARMPSWLMRMECSGMSGVMSAVVSSEKKNALIVESMLEVTGSFHSSQGGFGLLVGK